MTKYIDRYYLNGELYGIKFPGGGRQPGANTIAYYKLENDLNDYSGNNYNLTANSTVTYDTLTSGKGVTFFDDYASVSSFPAFTGDITISFYVRNNQLYSSYNNIGYVVKSNSTTDGWDESNSTGICYSGESQHNGFRWQPAGNLNTWPSIFTDTNWHYVVCTYERSSGNAYVYLDGVYQFNNPQTSYPNSNATSLYLCQKGGNQRYTYLSEVIIEDKIRTEQEIQDYFNQTKSLYGIS